VSLFSFGQDKEMFDYINTYRIKKGVKELKWSKDLSKISESHNDSLVSKDSLYHSGTDTYENCAGGNIWCTPITPNELKGFNDFLEKYYEIVFDPLDTTDFNKFIKLHVIYMWTKSHNHNKNILRSDVKYGSVAIYIGDFTFIDNKKEVTLFGVTKKVTFDEITPHNKGTVYSTLNLLD
jgi:uncharacterized protein YkwD